MPNSHQDSEIHSLWYTRCAVPTASSLAFQQGWLQDSFASIDISLNSVRAAEDLSVRESHYDNSLRNQFREGGNIPPIWARAIGQPTVVVGITWVEEFQAIVTGKHSEIKDISQLRGRRLGLPVHQGQAIDHGRASALHGFISALKVADIAADDVRFVDITVPRLDLREDPKTGVLTQKKQGPSLLDALNNGSIDALYIKGPGAIKQIRERGLKVLLDISAHPDADIRINNAVPRPITADRDLVIQRPDIVARYLAVLLKTGHWAKQHPRETLELVAHETRSSLEDAATAYGPQLHHSLVPTLDESVVAGLRVQKDFLLKWGFIGADFDFDSWIVHEPLRLAKQLIAEEPGLPSPLQAAS